MPDYKKILAHCVSVNAYSAGLIDQFLIYYAAQQNKLDREFDQRVAKFRHVTEKLSSSWLAGIKTQYIAHCIFKKNGLIHKYLKHAALKDLKKDEKDFLQQTSAHPWRFCFSFITGNPAKDFYEMEDISTGESFLLQSVGVGTILSYRDPVLWFNLIGFNGECWQTFGPLTAFNSFEPDDIFFYASEVNEKISSDEDLIADVEADPVPYMMLFCGSEYPMVISRDHEVVQVASEIEIENINLDKLKTDFTIESNELVHHLEHESLSEPPHYGEVYYDEDNGILLVTASTDAGYDELANILSSHGYPVPEHADMRVHPTMLNLIEKILKKKIEIDPFHHLFETPTSPETQETLDKMNHFMQLLLPLINSGEPVDTEELSKKAGIELEFANQIYADMIERVTHPRPLS